MRALTRTSPALMRWPQLRRLAAGALFSVLISGVTVAPASAQSLESRLRASFLYNFTLFVEWPAGAFVSATDALVIAIVGRDPFEGNLERLLDGKKVAGHSIKVVSISLTDQKDLARVRAHLLFVARSEGRSAGSLVEQIRTSPILTVSDIPEFAHLGGMIEFFEEEGTLRFEINQRSAEQAGLKLSSRLLSLARITPSTIRSP